jgi:lysozyme
MKTSERGIAEIKASEALRLFTYRDSAGVPTVGWGHTANVTMGQHITEEQAEGFLRNDIGLTELAVNHALRVPVLQHHFDAMVSLAFNIGPSAFNKSTLVQKINSGDFTGAADEFLRWNKATVGGQLIELEGLTTRRRREREMFLSGVPWPVHEDPLPEAVGMPPPPPLPNAPPRPDQEPYVAPPAPPAKETTVVAPLAAVAGGFLWELAKGVISSFTPLAAEKLTKEMNRHTDKPEIAGQIVNGVIEAVKAATGKSDPLEAVVAIKTAPPAMVAKVEADSLANLDKLMPVLERIQTWDQASWAAEEASRNAAAARAQNDEHDQDVFLTRSIIALLVGLMIAIGMLIGVLTYLKADAGTIGTLVGLFAATGGTIVAKFGTRYDHRYGSSRGSAAAGAALREIAARP